MFGLEEPRVRSAAGRQPHVAEKWPPPIAGGGVDRHRDRNKYLRHRHRNKAQVPARLPLGHWSSVLCFCPSFFSGVNFCFQLLFSAMSGLQAIKYVRGKLDVLDQLRLPHEFVYDDVSTCEEAFDCIKAMRVRGIESACDIMVNANVLKVRLPLPLLPPSLWPLSSPTRS